MAVGILAKLNVKEGKGEEFEAGFKALMAVVKEHEPGNVFYALNRSRESATSYVVMEQYVDQAALDVHGKSDEFKAASARIGGCLDGAPEIQLLDAI